ncbi:phage tail protein [Paraburkholderia pallida]|uniref:Phage tail protein n=1 Tax=Paraburkholderia pallida TaxID=2547399 RepID=A0A4P7CT50_9BURK|nr:phage tail protein [Paraburkholderia pallida]QBQ97906.1 phage tail protein [Paraburkholderia pallida]
MADSFQWFGQDIQFTSRGDDLLATGVTELNQRIVRALLTPPGTYIWHPTYGAGLGRFVGHALSAEEFAEIKSLINSVLVTEPDVQKQPPPTFTYQNDATGLLSVTIQYIYAPNGVPQTLAFNVPAYGA